MSIVMNCSRMLKLKLLKFGAENKKILPRIIQNFLKMCLASCYNQINITNTTSIPFLYELSLEIQQDNDIEKAKRKIIRTLFYRLAEELCQHDHFVSIRSLHSNEMIKMCSPVNQMNRCQIFTGEMSINVVPLAPFSNISHFFDLGITAVKEEMIFHPDMGIDKVEILNFKIESNDIIAKSASLIQNQNDNNVPITDLNTAKTIGLVIGLVVVAAIILLGFIVKKKSVTIEKYEQSGEIEDDQNAAVLNDVHFTGNRALDVDSPFDEIEVNNDISQEYEESVSSIPQISSKSRSETASIGNEIECVTSGSKNSVRFQSVDEAIR